jgi:hypothetical protein
MNRESPPQDLRFILFDGIEPEKNGRRFYLIGCTPTLSDERAVMHTFGRQGETQRVITAPLESLAAAWPLIRSVTKTRMKDMDESCLLRRLL